MGRLQRIVKGARRVGGDLLQYARGYRTFVKTGEAPWDAFMSMRQLYCDTDGWLNDAVAYAHRWSHPPIAINDADGALGRLSRGDIAEILHHLDRDGCYVFPNRVDDAVCDGLTRYALETPLELTYDQGQDGPKVARYEPANPRAVRYECIQQTLMESRCAQQLVADPSILAVAQAYLRCDPVQDLVAMWWSTAVNKKASSAAAQLYHFDMDRIKFLKFFVYLTDVGPDNGPHCYIRRSHLRKPRPLLRIERIADAEMFRHYPADRLVEITGPRGTVAAVDTRGFHKGKPLVAGHRLIFQIEFATSLFGYNYPKVVMNDRFTPEFRARVKARPHTYANFLEPEPGQGAERVAA
jgi:hypothetical protein